MKKQEQEPSPLPVEFVDTPTTKAIRIPCMKWQQAGHDVYSGLCPECAPNVTLERLGDRIKTEGHGHVHVNQPGRIICRCGTYLELYLPE